MFIDVLCCSVGSFHLVRLLRIMCIIIFFLAFMSRNENFTFAMQSLRTGSEMGYRTKRKIARCGAPSPSSIFVFALYPTEEACSQASHTRLIEPETHFMFAVMPQIHALFTIPAVSEELANTGNILF